MQIESLTLTHCACRRSMQARSVLNPILYSSAGSSPHATLKSISRNFVAPMQATLEHPFLKQIKLSISPKTSSMPSSMPRTLAVRVLPSFPPQFAAGSFKRDLQVTLARAASSCCMLLRLASWYPSRVIQRRDVMLITDFRTGVLPRHGSGCWDCWDSGSVCI